MINNGLRYTVTGLLAFLLGPVLGLILGKAGIIFGTVAVAFYLARRMGSEHRSTSDSARAGMLTVLIPALAAGLPARWIAEALFYNRYINGWEQVPVSVLAFVLVTALGAAAGVLGRVPNESRRLS